MLHPIPHNERERLDCLRGCGILDTQRDPGFDSLANLAQRLLKAPIAAISLVDDHRQWFKSIVGLHVRETPRDVAFCAHTIMTAEPLVVPDATRDIRFANNPLVVGSPHVRAYCGVPLLLQDGVAVGGMCVVDTSPREFSAEHIETLKMLATQAVAQIELSRAMVEQRNLAQQLDHAHRELRTIMDSSPVGMFLSTPTGECYYFNAAWERIAGITTSEAKRGGWVPRLHPEDRQRIVDGWIAAVADMAPFGVHGRFVHLNGELVHFDAMCIPLLSNGELTGYVGSVIDVTRQQQAEDALRLMHREQDAINRMLQSRNEEVLQLAFAMTHDLQSPLAAAQGQLAIAEGSLTTDRGAKANLGKCKASLQRMTRMLDDLMDYAKAGQERLKHEEVRVHDLVGDVVADMGTSAMQAGVRLDASLEQAVTKADPFALDRCVRNLIGNAIKFTGAAQPHAGEVRRVGVAVRCEPESVRIVVEDNGPGVPETMLTNVFLPFKRATNAAPGTGLGLATVKRYVEAFGGRVWLENVAPRGARAVIELGTVTREERVDTPLRAAA